MAVAPEFAGEIETFKKTEPALKIVRKLTGTERVLAIIEELIITSDHRLRKSEVLALYGENTTYAWLDGPVRPEVLEEITAFRQGVKQNLSDFEQRRKAIITAL